MYYIDFSTREIRGFLQDTKHIYIHKISYTLRPRLEIFEMYFSSVNPIKATVYYCFNYVWLSFEIMCIAIIVLLMGNMKLFTHYIF